MTAAGRGPAVGEDVPEFTLLPEQAAASSPDARPMRGVRALMIAVLEDAFTCIGRVRTSRSAVQRQRGAAALRWAQSDEKGHPFAFESICDVLGLDIEAMRERLVAAQWVAEVRGSRAPSAHRVERHPARIELPRRRSRRATERVA